MLSFPMRFTRMGTQLIISTPPARARSQAPAMIPWAAKSTACCAEPHLRSRVTAGTVSGKPAARTACLPIFPDCSATCMTQPVMTSSIKAGSSWLRSTIPANTLAYRSTGCQCASEPDSRPRPNGVRRISTITARRIATVLFPQGYAEILRFDLHQRRLHYLHQSTHLCQLGGGEHWVVASHRSRCAHLLQVGFGHKCAQDQFVGIVGAIFFVQLLFGRLLWWLRDNFLGSRRTHDLIVNILVDRCYRVAVETGSILNDLVGNDLVPFAVDHVEYGLDTHQL